MRGRRSAVGVALVAALCLGLIGAPVDASPVQAGTPNDGGVSLKDDFDDVVAEEEALLEDLAAAQDERNAAADQLRELDAESKAKQVQLFEAQDALNQAEVTLVLKVAAREDAKAEVRTAKERLRDQIVAAYVTGGDTGQMLEAFLNAENGDEIGQALTYGNAVSGNTASLVDDLQDAEAKVAKATRQARDAKELSVASRDQIAEAAIFLGQAHQQQQELVDQLGSKVLAEAEALQEVQGRKALIQAQVSSLGRASDGLAGILATLQAGQPDWKPGSVELSTPLPGVMVSSPFGNRHHPILGIDRLHAGADLGAPTGREIHAVGDGIVAIASERGGYGNTVVIDHGHSLASLYAHTSQMLVEPGQVVKRGEVIALVGSTGLSTGPHLHFETRLRGLPTDPENLIDFAAKVDYSDLDD